jgi:hypothetical protein
MISVKIHLKLGLSGPGLDPEKERLKSISMISKRVPQHSKFYLGTGASCVVVVVGRRVGSTIGLGARWI